MIRKSSVEKKYMAPNGNRVVPDVHSPLPQQPSVLDNYPHIQRLLDEEKQKYIRRDFLRSQKVEPQLNTPLFVQPPMNQQEIEMASMSPLVLERPRTAPDAVIINDERHAPMPSMPRPHTARPPTQERVWGKVTRRKGKFEAKVERKGEKAVYLGRFKTERSAHVACDEFIAQYRQT